MIDATGVTPVWHGLWKASRQQGREGQDNSQGSSAHTHTHTHICTYMGVSNLKASEWLGIITYLVVLVYALQLLEAST